MSERFWVKLDRNQFYRAIMDADREGNARSYALALAEHLFFGHGDIPWADEMLEQAGIEHERRKNAGKLKGTKQSSSNADSNVDSNAEASFSLSSSSLSLSKEEESEEKPNSLKLAFNEARKAYPGTKNGLEPEWKNFRNKHGKNAPEIIPLLLPAIEAEKAHKAASKAAGGFVPDWKNFQTWINKQCWTQELPRISVNGTAPKVERLAHDRKLG